MLDFNDRRWYELKDAYGGASELPLLLDKLKSFPRYDNHQSEPYFSLWSRLCHQGTIYTASYAAVPHIIKILCSDLESANEDFFLLPTCIEIARLKGDGPEIPADLEDDYYAALNKLPEIALDIISGNWSEVYCRAVLASIAATKGHAELADAILELSPENIEILISSGR